MSNTLKIILDEFQTHKGEFVITMSHKIERFIGIGTDDQDYYYITYNGRELTWNTCVGRLIYLKGKLDEKDYEHFIRIADLNHYDKILKGDDLERHLKNLSTPKGEDTFLSELFFEYENR
jgi:hypothetical protein